MIPFGPLCAAASALADVAEPAIPDVDDVVIASTGEQLAVGAPLQPADLPRVTEELHDFVAADAHVVMPDAPVAAARAQNVLMPG